MSSKASGGVALEDVPLTLPLDALPEEVLIPKVGAFHAPVVRDGETIPACGRGFGNYRKKDRKILRGTRDPCEDCFTERVIDEWDPEDEWE